MKKILVFNGSPRRKGNTAHLLEQFKQGALEHTRDIEEVVVHDLELEFCRGCLRCNLLGRCSIRGDAWESLSRKILEADVLVFGSPVYFHHVTAQLKKVIDRFRSFIQVEVTEAGLKHTPWASWDKDFVALLSMGSSSDVDAQPAAEMFEFMTSTLGDGNRLHVIGATRLAVAGQVALTTEQLRQLYPKLNLPEDLAWADHYKNMDVLRQCYELGRQVARAEAN